MLLPDTFSASPSSPVPASGDTIRAAFFEAARRAREAGQPAAPADLAAARAHLERGWP